MPPHCFGLIGYGHWGKNLARTAANHPRGRLKVIADPGEKAQSAARAAHPDTNIVADAAVIFADSEITAVIITSPAASHFALASHVMESGKHVLITKPVTETVEQAAQLRNIAARCGRTAVVDHTFLYHPCVARIKAALGEDWLGEPLVFDAVRTGLGIYKADVDIIADLAVHDLAILDYLFGPAQAVSAHTYAAVAGFLPDNAAITLRYASGLRAHVRSSWISPLKQRLSVLVGGKQMIVWDDGLGVERLRAFDAGVEPLGAPEAYGRAPLGYRNNAGRVLTTPDIEPLRGEIDDLIACMESGATPVSSLTAAHRVMATVAACQTSAAHDGAFVQLAKGAPI
ncbi:MAG: Gfo/Idh/MocA family oxidoreductase [Rhodospirillaceae bacterium]|nr:Gfo/Idh/MocA family oxidoreductase [Rhodospirillaceae bacterium]